MDIATCAQYALAGALRALLLYSKYGEQIEERVEISTPLNSWKRVTEGVFLLNEGIDPYTGDLLHETPPALVIYRWLFQYLSPYLNIIFILCDLLTAFILSKTARDFMTELKSKQNEQWMKYAQGTQNLHLKDYDFRVAPQYVLLAYLFNPYIILNCAGRTTTVFLNLFFAMTLESMCSGRILMTCFTIAVLTFESFYPIILLMPTIHYFFHHEEKKTRNNVRAVRQNIFGFIIIPFQILLFVFFSSGHDVTKSWQYLESVYGFILTVPDLKPNIGLFWYFVTEVFEHFRLLFIAAFQINATVLYLLPLTFKFRKEPMLLATTLCGLISVFKSYPCLGDVGFYIAILPIWRHLYNYMQHGFVIVCFFITTSALGPVLWHLWIYSRSANANFYFGVTLAFGTAQIFLITDLLFAYTKREFYLYNGVPRDADGKPKKIVLQ